MILKTFGKIEGGKQFLYDADDIGIKTPHIKFRKPIITEEGIFNAVSFTGYLCLVEDNEEVYLFDYMKSIK